MQKLHPSRNPRGVQRSWHTERWKFPRRSALPFSPTPTPRVPGLTRPASSPSVRHTTQVGSTLTFHSLVPQPPDPEQTLDPIPFQPRILLDNVQEEKFHSPGSTRKWQKPLTGWGSHIEENYIFLYRINTRQRGSQRGDGRELLSFSSSLA